MQLKTGKNNKMSDLEHRDLPWDVLEREDSTAADLCLSKGPEHAHCKFLDS